eukprot:2984543-Rhodomonas_salina.4
MATQVALVMAPLEVAEQGVGGEGERGRERGGIASGCGGEAMRLEMGENGGRKKDDDVSMGRGSETEDERAKAHVCTGKGRE